MKNWFDVDKEGLALLGRRNGMAFVVRELVANALDEASKNVSVTLSPAGRGRYVLSVEDDNPEGFDDLSHAFTLFAASAKKSDPTKRGRFNLGEKLVLAACDEAEIVTTKGSVRFDDKGRHLSFKKRACGSVFSGILKMTKQEYDEVCKSVMSLIVSGVRVTFTCGLPAVTVVLPDRLPTACPSVTLPTDVADDDGVLVRRDRKTIIRIFETVNGKPGCLYELGIPVVETGDKWDVDVSQKVPLNMDRDNVPPAYLKRVRVTVLNTLSNLLEDSDANSDWVRQATSDPECNRAAMGNVLDKRFGKKRVSFDPSDPEANSRAAYSGYTLVYSNMNSPGEWDNARKHELIKPAGQVFPSPQPYSADGKPLKIVPEDEWDVTMTGVSVYANAFAQHALGHKVQVRFADEPGWGFAATYGDCRLTLNLPCIKDWVADPKASDPWEKFDALLIHELGHERGGSDHRSPAYHEELCRLGAKMRTFRFVLGDSV
jgi:hypothetical protein